MFGLKIITKSEYVTLLNYVSKCRDLQTEVDNLKKERKCLLKELEKLDCTPKADRPSAVEPAEQPKAPLVEGHHVICQFSRPCDGCKDETPTCKKLYTGNGTICVEPDVVIKFD